MFGTYEAQALSTATIGSHDTFTGTARIVVEPGDAPLYVVLASYEQIIWRFEGDVSRISKVVLVKPTSGGPEERSGSGTIGIDAGKVSFASREGCFRYFHEANGADAILARGVLGRVLGRDPGSIAVGGKYAVDTVVVPSMAASEQQPRPMGGAPSGFADYPYMHFLSYHPAGVMQISPEQVVSDVQVMEYDVLPDQAGLAKLVAEGALEAIGGGGSNEYRVKRPIPRFPAQMNGMHNAKFILAKGVPMPAGSPGSACIISEETFEVLSPSHFSAFNGCR